MTLIDSTAVSVLNREPMGMKLSAWVPPAASVSRVSVLNREPMGMKPGYSFLHLLRPRVSVLNREPMGMKLHEVPTALHVEYYVSVLNREPMGMKLVSASACTLAAPRVSVLNREPMGMKLNPNRTYEICLSCFSAQPRADGDEAIG